MWRDRLATLAFLAGLAAFVWAMWTFAAAHRLTDPPPPPPVQLPFDPWPR
jgi:hypothetical protein